MRNTLPLLVAAFLNDAALYLTFAALPFRALELGAGPVALGALPTLYASAYMVSAAQGGRLSDRFSRLALARAGCVLFALGAIALGMAPSLKTLFLAIPGLGIALGLFWSPIQAALSDRAGRGELPRAIAAFNMSWSLGKGTGIVLGGLVADLIEPRGAILLAAAPALVTAAVLSSRWSRTGAGSPAAGSPAAVPADGVTGAAAGSGFAAGEEHRPLPVSAVRLAWMTNALAFGLVGTVNVHAPKLLLEQGAGPSAFGILFGAVFAVQTLTFLVLARVRPRGNVSLISLTLGLTAIAVFLLAPTYPLRVLAALPFGAATGLAYDASLHASLHRPTGRGRAAGLHEMLLGAGSSILPLLAGVAARASGSLRAPFVLAAAILAVGWLVSLTVTRRGPSRS